PYAALGAHYGYPYFGRYGYGYGYGPYYNGYGNSYGYSDYGYGNGAYQPGYVTNYGSGAYLGVDFDTRYSGSALVRGVHPSSAAAGAGLQPGDRIVAINGYNVDSWQDVPNFIHQMRPGDRITIQVAGPNPRT